MLCLTCFIGGNVRVRVRVGVGVGVWVCVCVEATKKQTLLTKSKELDSSKKPWGS